MPREIAERVLGSDFADALNDIYVRERTYSDGSRKIELFRGEGLEEKVDAEIEVRPDGDAFVLELNIGGERTEIAVGVSDSGVATMDVTTSDGEHYEGELQEGEDGTFTGKVRDEDGTEVDVIYDPSSGEVEVGGDEFVFGENEFFS